MSYEVKTFVANSSATADFTYTRWDGNRVSKTVSRQEVLPVKFFQRTGSNNPLNGPLLAYLRKNKPQRVRSYVKKVIVGYRYIYKKVHYTETRTKIVRDRLSDTFSYFPKYVTRISRSGKVYTKRILVRKRNKSYRSYTQSRLRFRKVAIRVPIKIRTRIYFIVPPKVSSELLTGKPFLLPNQFLFIDSEIAASPMRVESSQIHDFGIDANYNQNFASFVSHEGLASFQNATDLWPGSGNINDRPESTSVQLDVGRVPLVTSTLVTTVPSIDDIYLSATSVHGLYKKVSSDVPSSLTSLAELPETVKMVYKALQDGIKLAKQLRRLDVRSAFRELNRRSIARNDSLSGLSSKVWLTWYLAVAPTLEDAANHVALLSREERTWRKFSKSSSELVSSHDENPALDFYSQYDTKTTIKWSTIIEGRMTADQIQEKFSSIGSDSSAIYAVIPFSFIADWIVDISTWLSSVNVFDGLVHTDWKTSTRLENLVFNSRKFGGNHLSPWEGSPDVLSSKRHRFRATRFRCERDVSNDLPDMPLIPWKKQLVDQTLINRSLTSAALFRVLTNKKN